MYPAGEKVELYDEYKEKRIAMKIRKSFDCRTEEQPYWIEVSNKIKD